MSKLSDGCFGSQNQIESSSTTEALPEVYPTESIPNSMMLQPQSSPDTMNVARPRRHVHCHTDEGGINSIPRPTMNNSVFKWESAPAMPSYEEDYQKAIIHLQALKDDEGIPLPNVDTTASTALKADQPLAVGDTKPSSKQDDQDTFSPIINLTAKLERISTGDEIAPLNGHDNVPLNDYIKVASSHLGPHGLEPADFRPANSSVFSESTSITSMSSFSAHGASYATARSNATAVAAQITLSPITLNLRDSFNSYQTAVGSSYHQSLPALPPPLIVSRPSADSLASVTFTTPSSSGTSKKKKNKKKPKRVLDKTRVVVPTNNDVLFGRGPAIAKHPGNVKFHGRALDYWAWYYQSSKEEKQNIASILVDSVKSEGHRFLEKDGEVWREVIKGEHEKASQVFRDIHKKFGCKALKPSSQPLVLSPTSILCADVHLAFDESDLSSIPRSAVYRSFDEEALLNEDPTRVPSGQWIEDDNPGTVDLGYMDPALCFGKTNDAAPEAPP